ncbi:MAG TPA: 2-oxo-4-hydroxy-4-carboxy-5-ureidoimidazoline decarboxylase [Terriglobales bacterium]|jgi:2-oxo-4-hydroxy-4-carboxy-5-ureidoimidazoline decarboxylase|nr:2-oxo-4-hydroxy-4-carboxy-5-ureidoimidazoline decarboxylase [Terriglobales bacterium]
MTLDEVNGLDQQGFVTALGGIFEHSPWVAERAWASRPFATVAGLHETMVRAVERASLEQQLTLIRAHPDLGARVTPKMSAASAGEQAGAGLDRLTSEEFERLQALNSAYRQKFGFPFIYAVKGSTKHDVLRALEQRLQASMELERSTALAQIGRIAQLRLADVIQDQETR